MKSKKGSAFEREISEKLSLWWTEGKRTDIFWRTSGSGARARVRSKKKKSTSGQHGDITAIDPIGRPLIDKIVIELKRGYNTVSLIDLIDSPALVLREWIEQASSAALESAEDFAGPKYWMIIHKRDRRDAMVYISGKTSNCLPDITPSIIHDEVVGYRLDDFLEQISPKELMDSLT